MAVPLIEPLEGVAAEWEALADRCGPVPFARAWWADAWSGAFSAEAPLAALTVRDADGTLCGCLPVRPRRRRFEVPTNAHWPYLRPLADGPGAYDTLAAALWRMCGPHIRITPVHRADPLVAALPRTRGMSRCVLTSAFRPPLTRIDHADPHGMLSGKSRRALRRSLRQLADVDAVHMETVCTPAGAAAAFEDFVAVEASGWKYAAGTCLSQRPDERAFYASVVDRAAARGDLRIARLLCGDRLVATEINLFEAGVAYSLKAAYHREFAAVGPGHLLIAHVLDDLAQVGADRYEMLGADEPYKRRWTTEADDLVTVDAIGLRPVGVGSYVWTRGVPLMRRLVSRKGPAEKG